MMLFGEKYGDLVRVVEIPGYSVELCGGTHVSNIAEIGLFKITSEASSASGVRRIEAVTGIGSYHYLREQESVLTHAAVSLKSPKGDLPAAISRLQQQLKDARKNATKTTTEVDHQVREIGGFMFAYGKLVDAAAEDAKLAVDKLVEQDPKAIGFIAAVNDSKVTFFCKLGKDALAKGAHAGNIVKAAAIVAGGGGGGSAAFAQAGGRDSSKTDEAIEAAAAAVTA
ncbi:MAG: DHHA1 domain-containing protein, partial [Fimbriimonadales bacterium]